jgi:hypothetical protein
MKRHAESLEQARIAGFLGQDGLLYCSRPCADSAGQPDASPVEADEYDAVAERGQGRADTLCPVCGGEYPSSWPDDQQP